MAAEREPSFVVLEVPDCSLASSVVARAYYLEKFEVIPLAHLETSIEVYQPLSRAQGKNALVLIEGHTQNVGRMVRNRQTHGLRHPCHRIVLRDPWYCLVRHRRVEFDASLVLL